MRSFLSLALALLIFLAFGLFAFFYINISGSATFERTDKKEESPAPE